jgi:MarR family 2-MHQ and catechol resistance regulon transcriptional repressor
LRARYLRSVRLLAEAYQAFERLSALHVRELGLTPAQFDIVATLGNTSGMPFRTLGERTLITKGTLTGVVDRLEARGLVERLASETDRRSVIVRLTVAGEHEFRRVFEPHVVHCRRGFDGYGVGDLAALEAQLTRLRDALVAAGRGPVAPSSAADAAGSARGTKPPRRGSAASGRSRRAIPADRTAI